MSFLHEFFFTRDHVKLMNLIIWILNHHYISFQFVSASSEIRIWKINTPPVCQALPVSEVKPWDFYFDTTHPPKFSEFLEETLLPAYCVGETSTSVGVDEDMQRKIRFAAEKWYESCEVDDGRQRKSRKKNWRRVVYIKFLKLGVGRLRQTNWKMGVLNSPRLPKSCTDCTHNSQMM